MRSPSESLTTTLNWRNEPKSTVELVAQCFGRIHKNDGFVRAFVHLDEKNALARAQRIDAFPAHRPTLASFPIAVKDVVDVKGMPTRAASVVTLDTPAVSSAPIVAMLQRLGAIVLGKTNTHEFAFGAVTPPTRNPHDLSCIPGGSSGGSAAAVAAGFVRAAIGTDTGGSIRLPAALCGVYALRPLVSTAPYLGAIHLSPRYDAMGIMTSSLEDLKEICAKTLSIKVDQGEIITLGVPVVDSLDDEVARGFEEALSYCDGARAIVLPSMRSWFEPRMVIQMREALEVHRAAKWWPTYEHEYRSETRSNLMNAESISEQDVVIAERTLRRLDAAVLNVFDECDVIVTPTTPVVAPTIDSVEGMSVRSERRHPIVSALSLFTLPFSNGNLASLSVPWHRATGQLPVGVQLIARTEAAVMRAAEILSEAQR